MRTIAHYLRRVSPARALVEGWLACVVMVAPMLPVLLETTPLARSLYLVLVPLVGAAVTGLRSRLPDGAPVRAVAGEVGAALGLSLAAWGTVAGCFAAAGHADAIADSYAGRAGTTFFLWMAGPGMLAVWAVSWVWRWWNRLRCRRYVWALTHAILTVTGGLGLVVLTGATLYLARLFRSDIWQIPPDSPFAQAVFWLSIVLVLGSAIVGTGLAVVLPPAALFSYAVARTMTTRLERLAAATAALREGRLSTRLDVAGEDEIAQLQRDFNEMAADLETSVTSLQAERDKVAALLEARRDLVAEISHELRNPVAVILGYSDALRRDWAVRPAEDVTHDLATIRDEAARARAILNDLLTVSQVESGHLQVTPEPVDVTALAGRLVMTFAGLAWESRRVEVTLTAPDDGVIAWADPLRLEQVVANLVQNALRHTSPGGVVAVEVRREGGGVTIEVADTGDGIAPEALPHIWERYYRAEAAARGEEGAAGVGLGLSLVKELTEAMGGSVSVESQVGVGTVFRVRLHGGRGIDWSNLAARLDQSGIRRNDCRV